jgi:hypothetical protein
MQIRGRSEKIRLAVPVLNTGKKQSHDHYTQNGEFGKIGSPLDVNRTYAVRDGAILHTEHSDIFIHH